MCRRGVGDVSVEDLDGVLENGHFWPLDKKVPFLAVFLDVNSRGSTWLLDGGNFVATFHFFVATKFPASRFFKKNSLDKKVRVATKFTASTLFWYLYALFPTTPPLRSFIGPTWGGVRVPPQCA